MLRLSLIVLLSGFYLGVFAQNTSELWGESGELWNQGGRLPDYSYAGYHAGEDTIPNIAEVISVKDLGAKGDGITDDLQAFKDAIDAIDSGTILIPKGRYLLSGLLNVAKSNVVIRGEGDGEDGAVLYFTNDLSNIFGSKNREPWRYGAGGLFWVGKLSNLWKGNMISLVSSNSIRGSNILNLTDAGNLSAGDYIILRMTDPADHSLLYHWHNNQVGVNDYTDFPNNAYEWPVKIKSIDGNKVTLEQSLRCDVRTEWGAKVYEYKPDVKEVGVENLRIETLDLLYSGHHQEVGRNGLAFYRAFNCWVKNVSIKNTENAMYLQESKNCEIRGLKIYGGTSTDKIGWYNEEYYGHHGISIGLNSNDNLITDFYVYDTYVHDVTISHMSNGNVVRRGIGHNMNFDHHKYSPFENLFTNINTGIGNRVYYSSGDVGIGPHSAARETFWNLKSTNWDLPYGPEWGYIQINVVPCVETKKTADQEWYEEINDIELKDLFASQFLYRTGNEIEDENIMFPMIHPKPGIYAGEIEVNITSLSPGDTIRYTLDGSEPTSASPIFEDTFKMSDQSGSIRVKAKVFHNDGTSETTSSSYTFDNVLPEISSVEVMKSNQVKVIFDEPVRLSALNTSNYSIDNNIKIASCSMAGSNAVTILTTSNFSDSTDYILTVNNIEDLAGNKIEANSEASFNYETVISGIDELFVKSIMVYPNPLEKGDLNVDLSGYDISGYAYISVFDINGRSVFTAQINNMSHNERIRVPNTVFSTTGIYFINVCDNKSTKVTKLIVR